MEVHHHPQLQHRPKPWKEYMLEGLMIFIAVMLGFFAESFRERIVNNAKEHQYMESLVQDLQKDTAEMHLVIAKQDYDISKMDSSLRIPVEKLTDIRTQDTFYHHFVYFYSWVFLFFQNDNTITNLRNAGGFTVIRQRDVVDSIGDLELFYEKQVKLNGDYYSQFWKKLVDLGPKVMKMPEPPVLFDDTLFTVYPNDREEFTRYDRPLLEELYSCIRNQKGTLRVYMNNERQYLARTIKLIGFLRNKYQLNND